MSTRAPKPEQILIAEKVIESLARRYSSRPGLGDAVYEHLLDLGQRLVFVGDTGVKEKKPLFARWAWDMDTPFEAYLRIQLGWAFWNAIKAQRQQRELDVDRLVHDEADECVREAEEEHAQRLSAREARLLELADEQRSVAIFLALEGKEKASSIVKRYPGRKGTGQMSYEDLWAHEAEGRARVTADAELRRLSGLAPDHGPAAAAALASWGHAVATTTFWEPRDLTELELAELEVSAPANHFRPSSCERRTTSRPRSGCLSASPAGMNRATGAGTFSLLGGAQHRSRPCRPTGWSTSTRGPRPAARRCPEVARLKAASRHRHRAFYPASWGGAGLQNLPAGFDSPAGCLERWGPVSARAAPPAPS